MTRSKLAAHADWLMLQIGREYRDIQADLKRLHGVDVTHTTIMRYMQGRISASPDTVAIRAEEAERITREILESGWAKFFNEALAGVDRAKADGDEEGMRRWIQRGTELLRVIAPKVIQLVAQEDAETISHGGELREWAKKILS